MKADLTLPIEGLRPVRIRELKESALCLSYDQRQTHILVDRYEDRSKAIFLNGKYAFHCFDVDVVHDWKGLALTEYKIVVDVASAVDSANDWPPLGAITLGPDGVQLQVAERDQGFTDRLALKLGVDLCEIAAGLRVSFSRWAFRFGEGAEAQSLWIDATAENEKSRHEVNS